MKNIQTIREFVNSFTKVEEAPHFEKTSFRVKKKIFLTYDSKSNCATIKLSLIDQDVFSNIKDSGIVPVDNKWGKQGWTQILLDQSHPDICKDAITTAYCEVAPKKLAEAVRPAENL